MRVKIYILERNGIPYYVGKTIQSLQERLYTHDKNRKKDSDIIEIDDVDESEWEFWESHYIWLFRSWGFILENKNFGGGGRESGWESTPERNNKISQNRKGKGLGSNPKISEKTKGIPKPFTEKHRKNMEIAKRKQAKSLLQYSKEDVLMKEWDSKGEAAEWIINNGLSKAQNIKGQIKDCCLGRQKTAFGYKWKYKI
jgi:hypothetical protein